MNSGSATIVNRKVYYGGGLTNSQSNDGLADNLVHCYDPVTNCWTTLKARLQVKQFSLGRVDNELVATGGVIHEIIEDVQCGPRIQNTVYTFNKYGNEWLKEPIPAMRTARCLHSTVSLQSALVVAGGEVISGGYTDKVEVFKVDEKEWCEARPLPVGLFNFSMALLDDACYVVGGYNGQVLQQVYHANIEDLLGSASSQGHRTINTVWKTLSTNTPNSQSAAVSIAGNLLAIGGGGEVKPETETKESQSGVYVYSSSSKTWNHIGDLPTPLALCTAIKISALEILVIGGWASEKEAFKNTVIKGRLHSL